MLIGISCEPESGSTYRFPKKFFAGILCKIMNKGQLPLFLKK
jgi:hypothetical protein